MKTKYPTKKPNVPSEFRADGLPEGWCCGDAKVMLKEIIDISNPSVICEIGSFKGMSAYFMAEVAPEATIYCIDHWEGSPEHIRRGIDTSKLYETFIVNLWKHRSRIKPIRCGSLEGLEYLHSKGVKPEIIYVDGAHDYDSVVGDIQLALKLFPEAVICGDDYTLKGVRGAVDYVSERMGLDVKTYKDRVWRLRYV